MSMDRKNKKAAQAAASAANGGSSKEKPKEKSRSSGKDSHVGSSRNGLLSGSTAPTRPASSRPPINLPLKATISPSAPAPALRDTDFASFGSALDEVEANNITITSKPATPAVESPAASAAEEKKSAADSSADQSAQAGSPAAMEPLPVSSPRHKTNRPSPSQDFGPIGSPPRSNGFSPGTSPSYHPGISSSPFSAPHTKTVFGLRDEEASDFRSTAGIAASLGAMRLGSVWPSQLTNQSTAVEDDNDLTIDDSLEEALPPSLGHLLSPSQRSRRMSRTNSAIAPGPIIQEDEEDDEAIPVMRLQKPPATSGFSRSVPATSLLSDSAGVPSAQVVQPSGTPVKSIWAEQPNDAFSTSIGNGTPGSFHSTFGGRSLAGEDMYTLHPSNQSGAFLNNTLHSHMRSQSGLSNNLHPSYLAREGGQSNISAAFSPPRTNPLNNPLSRPAFENTSSESYLSPMAQQGRPIALNRENGDLRHAALSPTSRALQGYQVGQSLPFSAAGYSRAHQQPLPSSPSGFSGSGSAVSPAPGGILSSGAFGVGSPSQRDSAFASGFVPGASAFSPSQRANGLSNDWTDTYAGPAAGSASVGDLGAAAAAAQRAPYASISRPNGLNALSSSPSSSSFALGSGGASSAMNRVPSGGNKWGAVPHGVSSPLSRPSPISHEAEGGVFDME
jgi:hypothetical protein